jgi:hypothetical protein
VSPSPESNKTHQNNGRGAALGEVPIVSSQTSLSRSDIEQIVRKNMNLAASTPVFTAEMLGWAESDSGILVERTSTNSARMDRDRQCADVHRWAGMVEAHAFV